MFLGSLDDWLSFRTRSDRTRPQLHICNMHNKNRGAGLGSKAKVGRTSNRGARAAEEQHQQKQHHRFTASQQHQHDAQEHRSSAAARGRATRTHQATRDTRTSDMRGADNMRHERRRQHTSTTSSCKVKPQIFFCKNVFEASRSFRKRGRFGGLSEDSPHTPSSSLDSFSSPRVRERVEVLGEAFDSTL